jgi:hypothetical protein
MKQFKSLLVQVGTIVMLTAFIVPAAVTGVLAAPPTQGCSCGSFGLVPYKLLACVPAGSIDANGNLNSGVVTQDIRALCNDPKASNQDGGTGSGGDGVTPTPTIQVRNDRGRTEAVGGGATTATPIPTATRNWNPPTVAVQLAPDAQACADASARDDDPNHDNAMPPPGGACWAKVREDGSVGGLANGTQYQVVCQTPTSFLLNKGNGQNVWVFIRWMNDNCDTVLPLPQPQPTTVSQPYYPPPAKCGGIKVPVFGWRWFTYECTNDPNLSPK